MSSLNNDIAKTMDSLSLDALNGDEPQRLKLIQSAQKLVFRLQSPIERVKTMSVDFPIIFAALKTCLDLSIWEAWATAGGGKKTIEELANFTSGVDKNLLRRLLRILVAADLIDEANTDVYEPTPFSLSIGGKDTGVYDWIQTGVQFDLPTTLNLPTYLAKTNYKEPTNQSSTNFSDLDKNGLVFFDRLEKDPEMMASFNKQMQGWTEFKTPWTEIFDTAALVEGAKLDEAPLVVDIGGNQGLDISRVSSKHPQLPRGSLVLQDLAKVIANLSLDPTIEVMEHNFFTPQPVKGSRAYFMHAVLHDWPDSTCVQILTHIKDAMKKNYSKLLIQDIAIPPTGASLEQATMDGSMMALLSASERTVDQWKRLLDEAGLRLLNIWPDARGMEAVIEAELM